MSQTAGRNDPCPCGSGKKYKKCCWNKDKNPKRSLFSRNITQQMSKTLSQRTFQLMSETKTQGTGADRLTKQLDPDAYKAASADYQVDDKREVSKQLKDEGYKAPEAEKVSTDDLRGVESQANQGKSLKDTFEATNEDFRG